MTQEQIDIVVLWVDGSDPEFIREKQTLTGGMDSIDPYIDGDMRYRYYGTFNNWFRMIEKHAPWVNKVFLITNGQKPEWLNLDHPKLRLVTHKEFMPLDYLPTFNSAAIELNLHRIEELSEMNMIDSEFMEWLYENKMLDEDTFNEESSDSNDQWRMDNINSIQQSLNTFKKYITDQANQNSSWLSKNNDIILNANKYPVRNGANIKQAPDYKSAINRIKTPISTNLSGIDLKRIELPNQDPTQPKRARYIKPAVASFTILFKLV